MKTDKSSRLLINVLGIPILILIIFLGDSYNQLPIFSVFVAIVLSLGL